MWKLLSIQRLESNLFHSIPAKGKMIFLKLCFILNKGTLSTFLVIKEKCKNLVDKLYWENTQAGYFYKSCEKSIFFWAHAKVEGTSKLILAKKII